MFSYYQLVVDVEVHLVGKMLPPPSCPAPLFLALALIRDVTITTTTHNNTHNNNTHPTTTTRRHRINTHTTRTITERRRCSCNRRVRRGFRELVCRFRDRLRVGRDRWYHRYRHRRFLLLCRPRRIRLGRRVEGWFFFLFFFFAQLVLVVR